MIILMITPTGCSNDTHNSNEPSDVDLYSILGEIDYVINARYNGVDTIDFDRVEQYYTKDTYNALKDQLTAQYNDYISVEKEYQEAEKAFEAYKERIKPVDADKKLSTEHVKTEATDVEEYEPDKAEVMDIKIQMMSDIVNSEGDIVWKAKTENEINDMTEEEIQDFTDIMDDAIKSFTDKHSEYDKELQKKMADDVQRIADSKDNSSGSEAGYSEDAEIDMSDFETDARIKEVNGEHVIMLSDINLDGLDSKVLEYKIYGIDYKVDMESVHKPYKLVKGNEVYNFTRDYYALYDDGTLIMFYNSNDVKNNKSQIIELTADIVDGLIRMPDISSITTTEW
jgi:hypothetical protein